MVTEQDLRFEFTDCFVDRHIGPNDLEIQTLLKDVGYTSLDQLVDKAVPEAIRLKKNLDLPKEKTENQTLAEIRKIASQNQVFKSYLGMGYYGTITPPVIQRNILENPGWYTQYTPYQAEIAQGRLEALLNFQTMISDFTGLPIANASMLDEATAAAEAMALCLASKNSESTDEKAFFVSEDCHPQTIAVLKTRAEPLNIQIVVGDFNKINLTPQFFGGIVQYPTTSGSVLDYSEFAEKLHQNGSLFVVAADLLSLALLKPPASFGADVVVGSSQRFGVPLGFGGPHAAFISTKEEFKRILPGRIVGVSIDKFGKPAIRLALQTREQHIRREKATSNICTAQVLLAVMASMYAVYHGPNGIRKIASRVHFLANSFAAFLKDAGYKVLNESFFDTLAVDVSSQQFSADQILKKAAGFKINLRKLDAKIVGISFDETMTSDDFFHLCQVFDEKIQTSKLDSLSKKVSAEPSFLASLKRTEPYLTHPVFNSYHSETELLRYMHRLQSKDLSLTTSMIALGSCTMKLNATAEMYPVSWPEFGAIHPFVPEDQTNGYRKLFSQLEQWLSEITGFAGISLQPNAGSQGEYAGLLVIRKYHQSNNQAHRNICLIPKSAHGTNPASAVMAGMKVVVVECDAEGNVDLNDLEKKAQEHHQNLAAAMITYPSTHGVFEKTISQFCEIIHQHGGQVYMDGANMNAQVGLCRPGDFGPDVCHLNLHKTFCIPHGGGGPGMGPIGVKSHLVEYLPGHPVVQIGGSKAIGAVSAGPWGSSSILPISWSYIAMMGEAGLKKATQVAILNANYIAKKLSSSYPVLYRGDSGLVAHECILDMRKFKTTAGIEVEDIAKRLMDYGYHAPTVSFPVAGTMMIEPTESESKQEIDRFCDAMISIRKEIEEIENGNADKQDNVLKNAPHTSFEATSNEWKHSYSREKAVFPSEFTKQHKFWPSVARINAVHGDRNLVCACLPIEDYK